MRNITLAIDDATLSAGRQHAAKMGLSLNALVRKLLRDVARSGGRKTNWSQEFFKHVDTLKVPRKKISWTREELHER